MITVVSGLPRSGTSMMMQVLAKGGMEILTDNVHKPDESNPRGYFEFEKSKTLKHDNTWLHLAENKAVKIIAPYLYFLPGHFSYNIIFMERRIGEIVVSQEKMLKRFSQPDSDRDREQIAGAFRYQLGRLKKWLANQSNIRTIFISYNAILEKPESRVEEIYQFLGIPLSKPDMISVIDRSLYREKL